VKQLKIVVGGTRRARVINEETALLFRMDRRTRVRDERSSERKRDTKTDNNLKKNMILSLRREKEVSKSTELLSSTGMFFFLFPRRK